MKITKRQSTIDSLVLSDYIVKHYGPMSHLKLQKLLFYCDAYNLAYFDKELITDRFEAWVHGPVSRKVYNSLKDKSILYSDLAYIDDGEDVDGKINNLASSQVELLKSVLDTLSTWTGRELEVATHKERPWIEARKGYAEADLCCVEISKEITKQYYKEEQHVL